MPNIAQALRLSRGCVLNEESHMSGINGDKARFHRERKQKIARRQRNRELLNVRKEPAKPAPASSGAKPKATVA
jgi:hypothetical protein